MGLFKTKTVLVIVFSFSNPLAMTAGGNQLWKTPSIVITALADCIFIFQSFGKDGWRELTVENTISCDHSWPNSFLWAHVILFPPPAPPTHPPTHTHLHLILVLNCTLLNIQ